MSIWAEEQGFHFTFIKLKDQKRQTNTTFFSAFILLWIFLPNQESDLRPHLSPAQIYEFEIMIRRVVDNLGILDLNEKIP